MAMVEALEAELQEAKREAQAWSLEGTTLASPAQHEAISQVSADNARLAHENATMRVDPALRQASLHNENARLRAEHDALVVRLAQAGLGPTHDPQWFLQGVGSRLKLP